MKINKAEVKGKIETYLKRYPKAGKAKILAQVNFDDQYDNVDSEDYYHIDDQIDEVIDECLQKYKLKESTREKVHKLLRD